MKRISVLAVFLVCSAHFLLAQAPSVNPEDQALLGLELAWNQAELHHDANALDVLLTPAFMRVDNRGRMMGKVAYLAEIAKKKVQPSKITNEDINIQRYGETAIVVSTYRETGLENGKPFVLRGRFTDVWVRVHGKWQCASNQETLIH